MGFDLRSMLIGSAVAIAVTVIGQYKANADVHMTTDPTSFSSGVVINSTTNFVGYPGSFTYPGNPYTVDGITYTTPTNSNIIVGANSWLGNSVPAFAANAFGAISAQVNVAANAVSFVMGEFKTCSRCAQATDVMISIITNEGTYNFNSSPPDFRNSLMSFFGFTTSSASEVITGFVLTPADTRFTPAINNVQLATMPVPGPVAGAGLPALLAACCGLFVRARSRRQQAA